MLNGLDENTEVLSVTTCHNTVTLYGLRRGGGDYILLPNHPSLLLFLAPYHPSISSVLSSPRPQQGLIFSQRITDLS